MGSCDSEVSNLAPRLRLPLKCSRRHHLTSAQLYIIRLPQPHSAMWPCATLPCHVHAWTSCMHAVLMSPPSTRTMAPWHHRTSPTDFTSMPPPARISLTSLYTRTLGPASTARPPWENKRLVEAEAWMAEARRPCIRSWYYEGYMHMDVELQQGTCTDHFCDSCNKPTPEIWRSLDPDRPTHPLESPASGGMEQPSSSCRRCVAYHASHRRIPASVPSPSTAFSLSAPKNRLP